MVASRLRVEGALNPLSIQPFYLCCSFKVLNCFPEILSLHGEVSREARHENVWNLFLALLSD